MSGTDDSGGDGDGDHRGDRPEAALSAFGDEATEESGAPPDSTLDPGDRGVDRATAGDGGDGGGGDDGRLVVVGVAGVPAGEVVLEPMPPGRADLTVASHPSNAGAYDDPEAAVVEVVYAEALEAAGIPPGAAADRHRAGDLPDGVGVYHFPAPRVAPGWDGADAGDDAGTAGAGRARGGGGGARGESGGGEDPSGGGASGGGAGGTDLAGPPRRVDAVGGGAGRGWWP